MASIRLSKSKILSGLQCPKRLHLEIHQPELGEFSAATEQAFAVGHEVGEVARRLNPGGTLIGNPEDPGTALKDTAAALGDAKDALLYEPCFSHGGVLVRADIFAKRRKKHRLIEVKSSTSVKGYHYNDAAIQAWVLEGAGYPPDEVFLDHINNQFVYLGDGDYAGLFTRVDVTDEVSDLLPAVPEWVAALRKYLAGPLPDIAMGRQCNDPFACPFQGFCSKDQPQFPLSLLKYAGNLVRQLEAEGYRDLREVPTKRVQGDFQRLIHKAILTGKGVLDPGAAAAIKGLAYPRYYLDFETIAFAVPVWAGTRPYEKLPFQWSCHVEKAGGKLEHREFLDVSGAPPMRAFAESLIAALGRRGPILVYSTFERTILKQLIDRIPDLTDPLDAIIGRLFDVLAVARACYYHPDLNGSWSLKGVLPAIAPELAYDDLEVQDGGMAQVAYTEAIHLDTTPERKEAIRQALLRYCKRDTFAVLRVAKHFAQEKPPAEDQ